MPVRPSGLEDRPVLLVAQTLVAEDELPDLTGKLIALPLALSASGLVALVRRGGCAGSADGVGRCTQLVRGHMCHRHGLTRSMSGCSCCTGHLSRGSVGSEGGGARLRHRDLTPRPCASKLEGLSRTVVPGSHLLEVMQHMLGAVGRPYREQVVIIVLQGAPTTYGHEPGVSLLRRPRRTR